MAKVRLARVLDGLGDIVQIYCAIFAVAGEGFCCRERDEVIQTSSRCPRRTNNGRRSTESQMRMV